MFIKQYIVVYIIITTSKSCVRTSWNVQVAAESVFVYLFIWTDCDIIKEFNLHNYSAIRKKTWVGVAYLKEQIQFYYNCYSFIFCIIPRFVINLYILIKLQNNYSILVHRDPPKRTLCHLIGAVYINLCSFTGASWRRSGTRWRRRGSPPRRGPSGAALRAGCPAPSGSRWRPAPPPARWGRRWGCTRTTTAALGRNMETRMALWNTK